MVLFFKVYFINQVTDFTKGLSTVTTRYEYPETIEPPTVIICFDNPFKTSIGNDYGINSTYDIALPKSDFPYDEITYKLGRDFELVVRHWNVSTFQYSNPTILHEGLNSLKKFAFFVEHIHTYYNARCTKITPNFVISEFPLYIYFNVIINSNNLKNKEDHPTGLKLYLTSNDTWQGIIWDKWNVFQPTILEIDFKDTIIKKKLVLSPKKLLFKTGVDSISKCFEDIVLQLEKCGLECNPSVNKKPICSFEDIKTNESSYSNCGGLMAHNLFVKNCAKPNEALIFTPAITTPKIITKVKNSTIILKLEILNNQMEVREEKLITEIHDFIGSLGGSLGMFFGFSIISWIALGIDKIFQRF